MTVLDKRDGTILWTKAMGSFSTPTVAYGKIYVGTLGGEIWALDSSTGDIIWKYHIYGYGEPLDNPQVADGRVFFNNRDGWLFCVNATNGDFLWKYETRLAEVSHLAVADGRVFTIYSCLNESDGTLLWQYGQKPAYIHWTYHSPTLNDGKVFLSIGPALHCIDEFNGSLMWKFDTIQDTSDSAVAYGQVFVFADGYIYCLNEATGLVKWQSNVGFSEGYSESSPTVADNKVFVSLGQNLICLDVSTGNLVWKYFAPHWMHPPIVADGMVFVSWPGAVYAFGESTIPDIEFVSYNFPDTVLVSGSSESFEVTVNVKNVGKVEAKNVRLDFWPSWGNVSFLSREVINVPPDQTHGVSIKLDAVNTGGTHQAIIYLDIAYETPQGKTIIRDSSSAIGPPGFFITIVLVPPPPFYATPLGIIAIAIIALIAGVVITAIILRKK